jgi:hypothetical protein
MARATDASGETQPFVTDWNPSGYGWNVVPRIGVDVVENPPKPVTKDGLVLPMGADARPAAYKNACIGSSTLRRRSGIASSPR